MPGGVPLGRIAGIRIRFSWSLLVIVTLITLSLATSIFPNALPDQPAAVDWLLAGIATVLFFLSLFAHELAHALVARRHGVEVEDITLWLLGGIARLHGEAATPRDELRITGIGPMVTLVIAVAFGAFAVGADALGAPAVVVAVPVWLAVINVMLCAFNLVPAFPLDGGRVLHALLWRHYGDRERATLLAGRSGRTFGFVLIALGVFEFFAVDGLGGLWFVLLGWFLAMAAHAEEERSQMDTALAGVTVGDVMSRGPVVAPGWITVDAFIHDYVLTHRFSSFPVRDFDGRLTGLVTVRRLGIVPKERRGMVRVGDIATPIDQVPRATPDEPLCDLVIRGPGGVDGRTLVFEGERLAGIVSPSDVTRALQLSSLVTGRRAA